jgi:hypothetical protein
MFGVGVALMWHWCGIGVTLVCGIGGIGVLVLIHDSLILLIPRSFIFSSLSFIHPPSFCLFVLFSARSGREM